MKTKIEIQVLTPLTRQQLVELRDDIRAVEGMDAFDLFLPPMVKEEGKMGDTLMMVITHSVIAGVVHFGSEKLAHIIQHALKKFMSAGSAVHNEDQLETQAQETMGAKGPDVIIEEVTVNSGQPTKKTIYIDTNSIEEFTNVREYSINPERTHAVLIGTSKYDDAVNFTAIPPVKGNLDELYKIMVDKRLMRLPPDHIHVLDDTSSINIIKTLRDVSRIPDIDTLIVYYAGHGQKGADNKLNLIAVDTHNIDEKLHNAIAYDDVERIIKSSKATQKIVILDACHSGLAAQGNANIYDFEPVYGTYILASTSADDASYFKAEAPLTYFTSYMVQFFNQGVKNINTMLSLNDLYAYTNEQLKTAFKNAPLPVRKNDIKNVDENKFYISSNPAFDLNGLLAVPLELMKQHDKFDEAESKAMELKEMYPAHTDWIKDYERQKKQVLYARFIRKGDEFFSKQDYVAALVEYRKAQVINPEFFINEKVQECLQKIKAAQAEQEDANIAQVQETKVIEKPAAVVKATPEPTVVNTPQQTVSKVMKMEPVQEAAPKTITKDKEIKNEKIITVEHKPAWLKADDKGMGSGIKWVIVIISSIIVGVIMWGIYKFTKDEHEVIDDKAPVYIDSPYAPGRKQRNQFDTLTKADIYENQASLLVREGKLFLAVQALDSAQLIDLNADRRNRIDSLKKEADKIRDRLESELLDLKGTTCDNAHREIYAKIWAATHDVRYLHKCN